MATVDKVLELKKDIDEMIEDKHRAEGALERVLEQIKTDFECVTLISAEKKLNNMRKSLVDTKQQMETEAEQIKNELDKKE